MNALTAIAETAAVLAGLICMWTDKPEAAIAWFVLACYWNLDRRKPQ